jgi:uncharacterized protein (TIGR03492 family)
LIETIHFALAPVTGFFLEKSTVMGAFWLGYFAAMIALVQFCHPMRLPRRLLCLSNGHGEDQIALRVLQELQQLPDAPTIAVLPIVGEGEAYTKAGFEIIGPVKAMPSGGFIYMDGKQLARDIQGGLMTLTRSQLQTVGAWAKAGDRANSMILAVGDIVPLLFAWRSGRPFGFIGTAKSEYYLRDESGWLTRDSWWDDRALIASGCIYYPWERWLMTRPNCRAVFPRDRLTAVNLQKFGVPAWDLGNPMMDGLGIDPDDAPPLPPTGNLTIALIPGSRLPEAYANWEVIIRSVQSLSGDLRRSVKLLAAVTPALEMLQLERSLLEWQKTGPNTYQIGDGEYFTELSIFAGKFVECIQTADLAIAMAGTATEQFVGLGKPVISLPGGGPQFVPAFAAAQTRLLGASVIFVQHPDQVSDTIQDLLRNIDQNPDYWSGFALNGRQRMGLPGAARRIATHLMELEVSS